MTSRNKIFISVVVVVLTIASIAVLSRVNQNSKSSGGQNSQNIFKQSVLLVGSDCEPSKTFCGWDYHILSFDGENVIFQNSSERDEYLPLYRDPLFELNLKTRSIKEIFSYPNGDGWYKANGQYYKTSSASAPGEKTSEKPGDNDITYIEEGWEKYAFDGSYHFMRVSRRNGKTMDYFVETPGIQVTSGSGVGDFAFSGQSIVYTRQNGLYFFGTDKEVQSSRKSTPELALDASVCAQQKSTTEKDNCYMVIARRSSQKTCNGIELTSKQADCRVVATGNGKPTTCRFIPGDLSREYCYESLAAGKPVTATVCDLTPNYGLERSNCVQLFNTSQYR